MERLKELDKLEKYLKDHGYEYERTDTNGRPLGYDIHSIVVYENWERRWDAICHKGSYGYEEGLLEVMGSDVVKNSEDSVEGWLTADEIISRLEEEK